MTTGRWYSSAEAFPPLRIRVRVQWAGRAFEAVRIVHPKKKQIVWATFKDGEIEYLPPKGRNKIWGDHPELWQPFDPAKWEYPLPTPIPALSRPAWPQPLARASVQEGARDPLWWRDASRISYSEPGSVSRQEAEGRLMRALNTNWRIRVESPAYKTNADVIARMSATKLLADDGEPITFDWRVPFEPLGPDHDDFLTAMSWFNALNPSEMWAKNRKLGAMNRIQMALIYRAMDPPASWDFIGRRWGISGERVRQIYAGALSKIECVANGRPIYKHVRVRDPILAVRERNKRHAAKNTA